MASSPCSPKTSDSLPALDRGVRVRRVRGMKLFPVLLVGTLLAGCGGEAQKKAVQNEAPFVDKWVEWEANPEPYGGLEVLAKIKEAKESGAAQLDLSGNEISDLSPLKGLKNLEWLILYNNKITDISPLKGLTKVWSLYLSDNEISDISPLKELTNLKWLDLCYNKKITDLSPLAELTKLEVLYLWDTPIPEDQKAMLKKALPNCNIHFRPPRP